jgi:hypothetical protein
MFKFEKLEVWHEAIAFADREPDVKWSAPFADGRLRVPVVEG